MRIGDRNTAGKAKPVARVAETAGPVQVLVQTAGPMTKEPPAAPAVVPTAGPMTTEPPTVRVAVQAAQLQVGRQRVALSTTPTLAKW